MQSINDDMDELFRKAAADYPFADGTDWDAVMLRLQTPMLQTLPRLAERKTTALAVVAAVIIATGFVGALARRDNMA